MKKTALLIFLTVLLISGISMGVFALDENERKANAAKDQNPDAGLTETQKQELRKKEEAAKKKSKQQKKTPKKATAPSSFKSGGTTTGGDFGATPPAEVEPFKGDEMEEEDQSQEVGQDVAQEPQYRVKEQRTWGDILEPVEESSKKPSVGSVQQEPGALTEGLNVPSGVVRKRKFQSGGAASGADTLSESTGTLSRESQMTDEEYEKARQRAKATDPRFQRERKAGSKFRSEGASAGDEQVVVQPQPESGPPSEQIERETSYGWELKSEEAKPAPKQQEKSGFATTVGGEGMSAPEAVITPSQGGEDTSTGMAKEVEDSNGVQKKVESAYPPGRDLVERGIVAQKRAIAEKKQKASAQTRGLPNTAQEPQYRVKEQRPWGDILEPVEESTQRPSQEPVITEGVSGPTGVVGQRKFKSGGAASGTDTLSESTGTLSRESQMTDEEYEKARQRAKATDPRFQRERKAGSKFRSEGASAGGEQVASEPKPESGPPAEQIERETSYGWELKPEEPKPVQQEPGTLTEGVSGPTGVVKTRKFKSGEISTGEPTVEGQTATETATSVSKKKTRGYIWEEEVPEEETAGTAPMTPSQGGEVTSGGAATPAPVEVRPEGGKGHIWRVDEDETPATQIEPTLPDQPLSDYEKASMGQRRPKQLAGQASARPKLPQRDILPEQVQVNPVESSPDLAQEPAAKPSSITPTQNGGVAATTKVKEVIGAEPVPALPPVEVAQPAVDPSKPVHDHRNCVGDSCPTDGHAPEHSHATHPNIPRFAFGRDSQSARQKTLGVVGNKKEVESRIAFLQNKIESENGKIHDRQEDAKIMETTAQQIVETNQELNQKGKELAAATKKLSERSVGIDARLGFLRGNVALLDQYLTEHPNDTKSKKNKELRQQEIAELDAERAQLEENQTSLQSQADTLQAEIHRLAAVREPLQGNQTLLGASRHTKELAEQELSSKNKELEVISQSLDDRRNRLKEIGKKAKVISQDAIQLSNLAMEQDVTNRTVRKNSSELRPGPNPKFLEDRVHIQSMDQVAELVSDFSQLDEENLSKNITQLRALSKKIPSDTKYDALRTRVKELSLASFSGMRSDDIINLSDEDLTFFYQNSGKGKESTSIQLDRGILLSSKDRSARRDFVRDLRESVRSKVKTDGLDSPATITGVMNNAYAILEDEVGSVKESIAERSQNLAVEIDEKEGQMNNPDTSEDDKAGLALELKVLKNRKIALDLALQSGTDEEDATVFADAGWENGEPPQNRDEQISDERKLAGDIQKLRAEGRSQEDLDRFRRGEELEPLPRKETTGTECAESPIDPMAESWQAAKDIEWWEGTKAVGGALVTGGKFLVWDAPIGIVDFFVNNTAVKQGTMQIFSAMAQHNYMENGSKNSDTQTYRALAVALGADMASKDELPREMAYGSLDPLETYKGRPVQIQEVIGSENATLANVLTIGGNPQQGGYPYGTHERLQDILASSAPERRPAFVPPRSSYGNPSIGDPSYTSLVGRAYNGFPPIAQTRVNGAYLMPTPPQLLNNSYTDGSGIASSNFQSTTPNNGREHVESLASAIEAERLGVENFSGQLENVNLQSKAISQSVGETERLMAENEAIMKREWMIDQLAGNPNVSFMSNLIVQRQALLEQERAKLRGINQKIWDKSQEFRKADFMLQNDEDGLMIGGRKDWVRNANQRADALVALETLRNDRAQVLERVAAIQLDPQYFNSIIAKAPGIPTKKKTTPVPPALQTPGVPKPKLNPPDVPLGFLMFREVWADDIKPELVPNWREILETERAKIKAKLAENQKKLAEEKAKLAQLVKLDPDGVHEVNLGVFELEELNMKAIHLQAKQNLDRLKTAEENMALNITLTSEQKTEAKENIEGYRFALTKLEEESKKCANHLAKVRRLQIEKSGQYDVFQYYKERGEKILTTDYVSEP